MFQKFDKMKKKNLIYVVAQVTNNFSKKIR
jgi:hypothetical protein